MKCPNCSDENYEDGILCSNCGYSYADALIKRRKSATYRTYRSSRPSNSTEKTKKTFEEVSGWSWGAFGLTIIWGLSHEVNISLLMLVPGVNVVLPFVLGIKGREWAWEKEKHKSVKEFLEAQSKWDTAGIISFILVIILVLLVYTSR